jgi:CheY-like chemotaxis protein
MQPTQILVLGPAGAGRSALCQTLTRLGYLVMAAEPRPERGAPASGDIVMLDLRGPGADWGALAERLGADERPLVIVSERPRRLVRALAARPAGTMLLTGAESDAGYRVALTVCGALRRSALARAAERPRVSLAAL